MRVLLASDSYKGSLTTLEVAERMKIGALKVFSEAEFLSVPIADGGEGTVETMVSILGGHYEYVDVVGPNGTTVHAKYGVLEDEKAVIEMAEASGLTLIEPGELNVMKATTYGTGELIKAALDYGCRDILVGIGGSATNDGGVGMAQALGVSFKDAQGKEIGYGGGELIKLANIDMSHLDPRIKECRILVMSDVTNLLLGELGAAVVYGPQKGAGEKEIDLLEKCLKQLADVIENDLGVDLRNSAGAGAAGGLGMGMIAFLGAKIQSGIETILDIAEFERKMEWADLILTGEGRIDKQSAYGKVISGILKRAANKNVPVIAVAGSLAEGAEDLYQIGIGGMEAAVCYPMSLNEATGEAGRLVECAVERIMRSIRLGKRMQKAVESAKE